MTWNLPQWVATTKKHIGLFIVITTHKNKPISKQHSTSLPCNSKDCVYAPFISSSNIITFKPIQKKEYKSLLEKCTNGLPVNSYNSNLSSMNDRLPELLIDATSIFTAMPEYHGFVQVLLVLVPRLLTAPSIPSIKAI